MYGTTNNNDINLSTYLFWDVDLDDYNIDKYPAWTIQRVLEYGELSDWNILLSHFGIQRIADACKSMRSLDPKVLSFICLLSNTEKEDYRCYHTRQSYPTLWNS